MAKSNDPIARVRELIERGSLRHANKDEIALSLVYKQEGLVIRMEMLLNMMMRNVKRIGGTSAASFGVRSVIERGLYLNGDFLAATHNRLKSMKNGCAIDDDPDSRRKQQSNRKLIIFI